MSNQVDRKLLHEALLETFDRSDLKQMLDFELGVRLDTIAGNGNLSNIMFEVIGYFKRQDQLEKLVAAASAKRPRNLQLRALTAQQDPAHLPKNDEGATVTQDLDIDITGDQNIIGDGNTIYIYK